MTHLGCLLTAATLAIATEGPPPTPRFDAVGESAVQDLVILGETRPILIRFRIMVGDQSFRNAWLEATKTLHAQLDRNHDGKLTTEEAEAGGLGLLVISPGTRIRPEADTNPKDGVISVQELSEVLQSASGPFRVQVDGLIDRRTDALFDQFDRDKDGQLTRAELSTLVGSLRRLDRDDNELISLEEVAAGENPSVGGPMGRTARDQPIPAAVELVAGESPSKLVRLLMKKYDVGSTRGPGKLDGRLSPEEFAVAPSVFASADANSDKLLNADELRAYLTKAPRDAVVDVALSSDASGRASIRVQGVDGQPPQGFTIRQLGESVVEIDASPIRLDIHVDDGQGAADLVLKNLKNRFDAADASQDGYLEESELTQDNGLLSPINNLFKPADRDNDGKLYFREVEEFVAAQAVAARGRLLLTAANEGRALFGMLDLDLDRQLGAREVLDTYTRVTACDRDHDGRISPEEVPHHIQLALTRGDLSSLLALPTNPNLAVAAAVRTVIIPPPPRPLRGPAWFRKMDRNKDGDISRREFLGTRPQFDRLDQDHDGLLSPDEAEAAKSN